MNVVRSSGLPASGFFDGQFCLRQPVRYLAGGQQRIADFAGAGGGDGEQGVAEAVGGFAGALQENRGVEIRCGLQAVIAADAEIAQIGSERGEQGFMMLTPVAGGQNHGVIVCRQRAFAIAVGQIEENPVRPGAHVAHLMPAQKAM